MLRNIDNHAIKMSRPVNIASQIHKRNAYFSQFIIYVHTKNKIFIDEYCDALGH